MRYPWIVQLLNTSFSQAFFFASSSDPFKLIVSRLLTERKRKAILVRFGYELADHRKYLAHFHSRTIFFYHDLILYAEANFWIRMLSTEKPPVRFSFHHFGVIRTISNHWLNFIISSVKHSPSKSTINNVECMEKSGNWETYSIHSNLF